MNPGYLGLGIVHTVPEKLSEYFIQPLYSMPVILVLIVMFANTYMLRKMWKTKIKDYVALMNILALGIYIVMGVISAVLVSRLGPHGAVAVDECDLKYMSFPRGCFMVVAVINIVDFIVNIITKVKKNEEYDKTVARGYYDEDVPDEINDDEAREKKKQKRDELFNNAKSFVQDAKDKIDFDSIKDKIDEYIEKIKDLFDRKNSGE